MGATCRLIIVVALSFSLFHIVDAADEHEDDGGDRDEHEGSGNEVATEQKYRAKRQPLSKTINNTYTTGVVVEASAGETSVADAGDEKGVAVNSEDAHGAAAAEEAGEAEAETCHDDESSEETEDCQAAAAAAAAAERRRRRKRQRRVMQAVERMADLMHEVRQAQLAREAAIAQQHLEMMAMLQAIVRHCYAAAGHTYFTMRNTRGVMWNTMAARRFDPDNENASGGAARSENHHGSGGSGGSSGGGYHSGTGNDDIGGHGGRREG